MKRATRLIATRLVDSRNGKDVFVACRDRETLIDLLRVSFPLIKIAARKFGWVEITKATTARRTNTTRGNAAEGAR